MVTTTIRPVESFEIDLLQQIAVDTFTKAFESANTKENLNLYLENAFNQTRLRLAFANPESQFFFAETDNTTLGYLKVNTGKAQSENLFPEALEVERIYVLPGNYGKGVGQALLNHAFGIAKVHQMKNIWLGVWEHNPRAIRFYEKNGFAIFDKHPFMMGKEEQTDYLMHFEM